MAYEKQTWNDGEVITKEKLNHIEEGIFNIELTPGPQGATGATGPQGPAGQDAVINKLDKIDVVDGEAVLGTVVTVLNSLIADLKAKGLMNDE
ncbi:hypothetical protein [Clostridium sp.]|uniref:hypothetical protein n=1 Tax=Clostridium sp. TaxID=1506 RepID=UPI0025C18BC9|nr:hypothetical protein [Clostridium sp.]